MELNTQYQELLSKNVVLETRVEEVANDKDNLLSIQDELRAELQDKMNLLDEFEDRFKRQYRWEGGWGGGASGGEGFEACEGNYGRSSLRLRGSRLCLCVALGRTRKLVSWRKSRRCGASSKHARAMAVTAVDMEAAPAAPARLTLRSCAVT